MVNLKAKKEVESELSSSSSEVESEFSARLREAIGGDSVLAFAKKCGISDSLVRKYLSGSLPGLDKLILLCETAGVRVGWLATGELPKEASGSPVSVRTYKKPGDPRWQLDQSTQGKLYARMVGPLHELTMMDEREWILDRSMEIIEAATHADPSILLDYSPNETYLAVALAVASKRRLAGQIPPHYTLTVVDVGKKFAEEDPEQ